MRVVHTRSVCISHNARGAETLAACAKSNLGLIWAYPPHSSPRVTAPSSTVATTAGPASKAMDQIIKPTRYSFASPQQSLLTDIFSRESFKCTRQHLLHAQSLGCQLPPCDFRVVTRCKSNIRMADTCTAVTAAACQRQRQKPAVGCVLSGCHPPRASTPYSNQT